MTPQERETWVGRMGARREWWGRRREAALEPGWEVIDAHCHFWDERCLPDPTDSALQIKTSRFLPEEFLRDIGGHKVTQIVYVECGSGYATEGPPELRPVGETAFAVGFAEQLAALDGAPCIAAIVAHADLRHPNLGAVLDAHEKVGGGRLRSIRHSAARLEEPSERLIAGAASPGLYRDKDFHRGVALLGERSLAFDAFQFHFQLEELAALARSAPNTTIVVNHLGGPAWLSPKAESNDRDFVAWARRTEELAALANVVMKLGGLASIVTGYDGYLRSRPPSSQEFVDERGGYFHHAIRCFGPERCLFESNFPVDSVSISYGNLWNAYKLIAMDYGDTARRALLTETARRVYRM
jgi:predicted TIM-barrel fold metal-dependent hydrolase